MATSATPNHTEAPPGEPLDLLRNRNEDVPLKVWDSKVSSIVRIDGETYFITTNADYIPAVPIRPSHSVFLRADMRYGDDDPTLWPQSYSDNLCHLAAIRSKPLGTLRGVSIMWWNPAPEDFIVPETGRTVTRGLGKLRSTRIAQLNTPISTFFDECKTHREKLTRVHEILDPLVMQIRLGIERLATLPSTFTQMVVAVTTLQRVFLEAEGLVRYMTIFKSRMGVSSDEATPRAEHCIGAFTTQPTIAQQFRAAGLPYWLLRPTWTFTDENILQVVEPLQPGDSLNLEPAEGANRFPTRPDTDSKIHVIQRCSRFVPWYTDPFTSSKSAIEDSVEIPPPPPPTTADPSVARTHGRDEESGAGSSRGGRGSGEALSKPQQSKRFQPYPTHSSGAPFGPSRSRTSHRGGRSRGGHSRGTAHGASTAAPTNRDKFVRLERDEMPSSIPAWEQALKEVDRTIAPRPRLLSSDGHYVFPEPALVVSSDDPARRQLYLHHLSLIMDAIVYRMGDRDDEHHLLPAQQWRDLLVGNPGARTGTKAATRSLGLHDIFGRVFRACGLTESPNFPAAPGSFPPVTLHRAQAMLWLLAETNFRYEFLALDRRASRLDRADKCRECFAGGMLVGMPLELAREGLASLSATTRHPFIMRMAKLMRDWDPRPRSAAIAHAQDRQQWGDTEMQELEKAVAEHYTQAFYHHFGRAAVVPMRLVDGGDTRYLDYGAE